MPSKKARINLTVDDELNTVLKNLSELMNQPKAGIIVSFLKDLMPVFLELEKSLRRTKELQDNLPELAKWAAKANQQAAILNNEMANLYQKMESKDD